MQLTAEGWADLVGEGWTPPPGAVFHPPEPEPLINVPNAISLAGVAATCAWLAGGSVWWLVLGLGLDELDGEVARNLGQTSGFGSQLDWTIDVATMGAIAVKLMYLGAGSIWVWSMPVVIAVQAYMRNRGQAPAFGSARAAMVLLGLPGAM